MSIAYLSDLERGVLDNPTLDKLRGIAAALGVSLNELLDVPERGEKTNALAPALRDFARGDPFRSVTAQQAKELRRGVDTLRAEWIALLQSIEVAGRRPTTATDYLFIFEAVRRAVEPR